MRGANLLIIATFLLSLGGCASSPSVGGDSTAVAVASALPPPDATARPVDLSDYRIGPLDQIKIDVFGAPELTREGEVDAAGNFSMPLVGTVSVGGRTPSELSAAVADQLRGRYLKNPQVSVSIVKARGQTFTVDGAVKLPGVFPIVGRLSLQQAIATARGTDSAANLKSVAIFRTVNNQKMAALFNLQDIRAGRQPDPDVYGNDIIVVGESGIRRFFTDFGTMFPVLGRFVPVL